MWQHVGSWQVESFGMLRLLSALTDGVGGAEHNRSLRVLYSSPEGLVPIEAYICRFEQF